MARRPLVMGNWKLNGSKAFTKELIEGLKAELQGVTGCDGQLPHLLCTWVQLKRHLQAAKLL